LATLDTDTHYRSLFPLVDEAVHTYTIHDGPIHAPGGAGAEPACWTFALIIPTRVPPAIARNPHQSYLPLNPGLVAAQTLPSTMSVSTYRIEAYVEYWLEASLHIDGQSEHRGTYDATLPFNLRSYRPGPPITDFRLKLYDRRLGITSHLLVPGAHAADSVSAKTKVKRFFGSNHRPALRLLFEAVVPGVIQLDPPQVTGRVSRRVTSPIPFLMRVVPDWSLTSDIIRDVPQKVMLLALRLTFRSIDEVILESIFTPTTFSSQNDIDVLPGDTWNLPEPIQLPFGTDAIYLDVGAELNLRLDYNGLVHPQLGSAKPLLPTCKTYNIKHDYRLVWEAIIEVADGTLKPRGVYPVTVLPSIDPFEEEEAYVAPPPMAPRSDSWIRPPAEADAPPAFEEAKGDAVVYGSAA
jgi:hypothetical protein